MLTRVVALCLFRDIFHFRANLARHPWRLNLEGHSARFNALERPSDRVDRHDLFPSESLKHPVLFLDSESIVLVERRCDHHLGPHHVLVSVVAHYPQQVGLNHGAARLVQQPAETQGVQLAEGLFWDSRQLGRTLRAETRATLQDWLH